MKNGRKTAVFHFVAMVHFGHNKLKKYLWSVCITSDQIGYNKDSERQKPAAKAKTAVFHFVAMVHFGHNKLKKYLWSVCITSDQIGYNKDSERQKPAAKADGAGQKLHIAQ